MKAEEGGVVMGSIVVPACGPQVFEGSLVVVVREPGGGLEAHTDS